MRKVNVEVKYWSKLGFLHTRYLPTGQPQDPSGTQVWQSTGHQDDDQEFVIWGRKTLSDGCEIGPVRA